MKNLLLLALLVNLLALTAPAQAQKGRYATNYEEYQKMFHNSEVRMVRSHRDFVAYAKNNRVLKMYVKGSALKEFLQELKFSKNGLITCSFKMFKNNPRSNEIFGEVARGFGWEPPILAADHKGYKCSGNSSCVADEDYICLGKSCGEAVLNGPDYQPERYY